MFISIVSLKIHLRMSARELSTRQPPRSASPKSRPAIPPMAPMERDQGQIRVDNPAFHQHQFFPGGAGKQLTHPSLSTDCAEAPWLVGTNRNCTSTQMEDLSPRRQEWHTKSWDWDSVRFTAQHAAGRAEGTGVEWLRRQGTNISVDHGKETGLGFKLDSKFSGIAGQAVNDTVIHIDDDEPDVRGQPLFGRETPSPPLNEANSYSRGDGSPEDDGPLSLKLGGSSYLYAEENGARNGKRNRSCSPLLQLPTCQVDDCSADLSKAKDYHRRHKVCEMHSKAAKVVVTRLMQRFCQQCSRFHPLGEFDEGKRSCRRRLAGHNRRRRKPQPDAVAARAFLMAEDHTRGKSSEILSILSILSQLQATAPLEGVNSAANEQDVLLRCLKQAGSLPTNSLEDSNRIAPSWSQLTRSHGLSTAQSEPNLLASQPSRYTPIETSSAEAQSLLLLNSLKEVARVTQEALVARVGESAGAALMYASSSVTSQAFPLQTFEERISSAPAYPPSVPLPGRFANSDDRISSRANAAVMMHQNMAEQETFQANQVTTNGNAIPRSVALRNFPLQPNTEVRNSGSEVPDRIQESKTNFNSKVGRDVQSFQNLLANQQITSAPEAVLLPQRPNIDLHRPPQHSDTSQSGSDQQSQGTPGGEWEERNSRISFKLFGKHPGQFPQALRTQIDEWLSHRPSDMESFIRPGCVILTVFLSMPKLAWIELISDLPGSLKKLLSKCSDGFWCNGRILVQVERQSVLIIDGEIIGSTMSEPLYHPYIQSVRPLAIVAGQETSMVVKGFNLTKSGTRILCAFRGKYLSQEVFRAEQDQTETGSVSSGEDSDFEESSAGGTVLYSDLTEVAREEEVVGKTVWPNTLSRQDECETVEPTANGAEIVDQAEDVGADKLLACTGVSGEVDGAEAASEFSSVGYGTADYVSVDDTILRTQEAVVQLDGKFFSPESLAYNVGRCFIEVDQDTLEGNWKPVIVADGPVCSEIRTLEHEIEAAATIAGKAAERQGFQRSDVLYCTEVARLVEEEEVTCFLHELGWFLQRSCSQHLKIALDVNMISSTRVKQLLVYSVERNWCAVVRKVFDICFEKQDCESAFLELADVLQEEVSLLHRAVQKRCRQMAELLLAYVPPFLDGANDTEIKSFQAKLEFKAKWENIFKPDMDGPAGLTPLHVAASLQDAEEVVDALTSDPCQVGLHTWLNKQDDGGETPLSYAIARGNMKSVQLVRAKLALLETADITAIDITHDPLRHQRESLSVTQVLELPVWRRKGSGPIDAEPTCRDQDFLRLPGRLGGVKGHMKRPFLLSLVSIASVCVCVCLVFKGLPDVLHNVLPFSWELLKQGPQ